MKVPLSKLKSILSNSYFILSLYCGLAILLSLRSIALGVNQFGEYSYTFYNNYIIFKNSFLHLLSGQNMYILYPSEQWDLYKYSPPFAVFMFFFAYLPDWLGLIVWNLLNHLVLFWGLKKLPFKNSLTFGLAALYIIQELSIATANSQSNALIAGLLLLSFDAWKSEKIVLGSLYIALATFIKPFAIVFYLIWFFYPKKLKAIFFSILIFTLIALSPILVVGWSGLIKNYQEWFILLQEDHNISFGVSAMGLVHTVWGISWHKEWMVLISSLFLLTPLIRIKQYKNQLFTIFYICFLLIWMVIFNHRAESPTYIIAVTGVAVWYFISPFKKINLIGLILVLLFTQFSTSDIYPGWLRSDFFEPYEIKAIPCILVWLWIGIKLHFYNFNKNVTVAS
jgi:hypothetical protein